MSFEHSKLGITSRVCTRLEVTCSGVSTYTLHRDAPNLARAKHHLLKEWRTNHSVILLVEPDSGETADYLERNGFTVVSEFAVMVEGQRDPLTLPAVVRTILEKSGFTMNWIDEWKGSTTAWTMVIVSPQSDSIVDFLKKEEAVAAE